MYLMHATSLAHFCIIPLTSAHWAIKQLKLRPCRFQATRQLQQRRYGIAIGLVVLSFKGVRVLNGTWHFVVLGGCDNCSSFRYSSIDPLECSGRLHYLLRPLPLCCSEAIPLCILPHSVQSRARFITSMHAFLPPVFHSLWRFCDSVVISRPICSFPTSVAMKLTATESFIADWLHRDKLSSFGANLPFRVAPESKLSLKMAVFWGAAP